MWAASSANLRALWPSRLGAILANVFVIDNRPDAPCGGAQNCESGSLSATVHGSRVVHHHRSSDLIGYIVWGSSNCILLVLATTIVGLAITTGIRAFSVNSAKANADAMIQDALRIAIDAQAWKQKPQLLGGQGPKHAADPDKFKGATLAALGYPGDDDTYANQNGVFSLKVTGNRMLIVGTNAMFDSQVEVVTCGLTNADILGEIVALGGEKVGMTPKCPTDS